MGHHDPTRHPVQDLERAVAGDAPPPAQKRRWALLALLCLAQFMLILDVTAIDVALPSTGVATVSTSAATWIAARSDAGFGTAHTVMAAAALATAVLALVLLPGGAVQPPPGRHVH